MNVPKISILVLVFLLVCVGNSRSSSIEELRSLPYLAWSEKSYGRQTGVVTYNKNKAFDGYNLYTDATDNAFLIDMKGQVIHRWKLPSVSMVERWLYVRLANEGSILAVSEKKGFVKIDKNSKLIWTTPITANHEIEIIPDGTFLVQKVEPPVMYKNRNVVFDSIAHISKDGKVLDTWRSYDHLKDLQKLHPPSLLDRDAQGVVDKKSLQRNFDYELLRWNYPQIHNHTQFEDNPAMKGWYEYYHLNSIQVLPQTDLGLRDKRFQEGNWLICFRNVNLILILDRKTRQVTWSWGAGILDGPHMPRMLNNGKMLIYDNGIHRSYSRLIIVDPVSNKIEWEYKANPPERFHSQFAGSSQLLPNGNFFICETTEGRAFEITPSGEIVWEFLNDIKKDGKRRTLYRMIRVLKEEFSGVNI